MKTEREMFAKELHRINHPPEAIVCVVCFTGIVVLVVLAIIQQMYRGA